MNPFMQVFFVPLDDIETEKTVHSLSPNCFTTHKFISLFVPTSFFMASIIKDQPLTLNAFFCSNFDGHDQMTITLSFVPVLYLHACECFYMKWMFVNRIPKCRPSSGIIPGQTQNFPEKGIHEIKVSDLSLVFQFPMGKLKTEERMITGKY